MARKKQIFLRNSIRLETKSPRPSAFRARTTEEKSNVKRVWMKDLFQAWRLGENFFFTTAGIISHNRIMKKYLTKAALASLILIMAPVTPTVSQEETRIPLTFKNVVGTWALKYSGNYGYQFSFYANYRALVILYLNMETLVFKGVYTLDEGNKLKINIYEMKDERRAGVPGKGFVKAKSSYFLFNGYETARQGRTTLFLRPRAIIIDGNNSEGYFEPLLKLAKI